MTWNRIVSAARAELAENENVLEISVRAVATRAGVSPGTVHYYFPSKERLLEACLDEYYEQLLSEVDGLSQLLAGPDSRGAVEAIARSLYRFVTAHRNSLRLRSKLNSQAGQLQPERAIQVRGPLLDEFAARLAAVGHLDAFEARLTIETLTGVLMQFGLLADADVAQITGETANGRAALESHFARVAVRLLFPQPGH